MSNFRDTTIKALINGLNQTHFLPGIQREFIWKEEQITNLFDSILRSYPIGSFLFWRVEKEKLSALHFYNFIQYYHSKTHKHNEINSLNGEREITAVLDGQQRLNSLFVGLKGTYTSKKKYFQDVPEAYPKRKLYINLLSYNDKDTNIDNKYILKFLEKEDVLQNEKEHWFEIGTILDFKVGDITKYLLKHNLTTHSNIPAEILEQIDYSICKEGIISFYEETDQDIDKVLDIFVRINSSGTKLSYSDLLLSVLTAQFKEIDIREEINDLVDHINNDLGFDIDKNFILKSFLFLLDAPVKFILENFKKDVILKIETNFITLKERILASFHFLKKLGFNKQILTSNYPVTIIAYYLYKRNLNAVPKEERQNIKMFVIKVLLSQIFGGTTDNVLGQIRNAIQENNTIDIDKINNKLSHKIKIDKEVIEEYTDLEYTNRADRPKIFLLFFLLYPHLDFAHHFHIDHIFPKQGFSKTNLKSFLTNKDDIELYMDWQNYLCNLQLLEGLENIEKSSTPLDKWLDDNKTNKQEWQKRHYIPSGSSLDFIEENNFTKIMEKREEKMLNRLKEILL
jgi:uncharacterized protein with ParB-like and HNH nuclease domain